MVQGSCNYARYRENYVNLGIESTDKARNVVNNVGQALAKKKVPMLCSKDIDMINNLDIYDTYKDLYLNKKECEKLLQGIQSANGLKARVDAKKQMAGH